MTVGILTFHSQLNYGGVLQCWALQTVLEKMGHKVVVIDRWLSPDNWLLERGFNQKTFRGWIKFWVRSFCYCGDARLLTRVRRTKRFLARHLHLTPFHFVDWKDAPQDLGVDVIIVGSDQVWHCGDYGDPRPYLLDGAPPVPAVAYAASFGFPEFPQRLGENCGVDKDVHPEEVFRKGLGRFKAVGCRETEGVAICRKLGFIAAHVVDPVLLAFSAITAPCPFSKGAEKRTLVCYFIGEKLEDHYDTISSFVQRNGCTAKIFLDYPLRSPMPSSSENCRKWLRGIRQRLASDIRIMDSAGPQEFSEAFSSANWIVSDSFHALMFAIGHGANARIIQPITTARRQMFARIEEFAAHAKGRLVSESVKEALKSFEAGDTVEFDRKWIGNRCRESFDWLKRCLP